jgi:hypothetical protein
MIQQDASDVHRWCTRAAILTDCRLADVEMIFETQSSSFKNLHDEMSSSTTIFLLEIWMTEFQAEMIVAEFGSPATQGCKGFLHTPE